ncbi:hypothetical protein Hanom_Chr04g00349041 [Helianthus anomalus]
MWPYIFKTLQDSSKHKSSNPRFLLQPNFNISSRTSTSSSTTSTSAHPHLLSRPCSASSAAPHVHPRRQPSTSTAPPLQPTPTSIATPLLLTPTSSAVFSTTAADAHLHQPKFPNWKRKAKV